MLAEEPVFSDVRKAWIMGQKAMTKIIMDAGARKNHPAACCLA
jgi:hypothetical protein